MEKSYLFVTSLIFATMINVSYLTRDSDKIWEHSNRETHKPLHDSDPYKALFKANTSDTDTSTESTNDIDPIWAHAKPGTSDTHTSTESTNDIDPIRAHAKPGTSDTHTSTESTNDIDSIWAHAKPGTSDTHTSTESSNDIDPIRAHAKPGTSDTHTSTESTNDIQPIWAHAKPDTSDTHKSTPSISDINPIWKHGKPETHSPPTIIIKSSNIYKCVERNDKLLKIICETTGYPKPVITWKLNDRIISNDYKYSIEDGNLIIKNPTVSDSQSYTCEANNGAGSVIATFQAEVLQTPRVRGAMLQIALVGESVRLGCTITRGVPKPELTWQFKPEDGSKYVLLQNMSNEEFSFDYLGSISSYELKISNVNLNHAGVYKCIARNSVGESAYHNKLVVESPPIILTNSSVTYKGIEGQDELLRVPCVATGHPDPDLISWHFYGVASAQDSKYSIDENGTLVIKNVTVSDSKIYTCKASNEAGSSEKLFKVEIAPENTHGSISLFRKILRSVIARWFQPTPAAKTPIILRMAPRCIQNPSSECIQQIIDSLPRLSRGNPSASYHRRSRRGRICLTPTD